MYSNFEKLLKSHGVSPYKVAKETGISQATLSDWKNGKTTPKNDKLQLIADYFHAPIAYLITGNMPELIYADDTLVGIAQTLLENQQLRALFEDAIDADPEDIKVIHDVLLALKRKERKYK